MFYFLVSGRIRVTFTYIHLSRIKWTVIAAWGEKRVVKPVFWLDCHPSLSDFTTSKLSA